jgi:hypothetical protein
VLIHRQGVAVNDVGSSEQAETHTADAGVSQRETTLNSQTPAAKVDDRTATVTANTGEFLPYFEIFNPS